jgi:hypothetical protein
VTSQVCAHHRRDLRQPGPKTCRHLQAHRAPAQPSMLGPSGSAGGAIGRRYGYLTAWAGCRRFWPEGESGRPLDLGAVVGQSPALSGEDVA